MSTATWPEMKINFAGPAIVAGAAGIESRLGLPIKLTGSLNRGKIELRYSSREELERVCAKLLS